MILVTAYFSGMNMELSHRKFPYEEDALLYLKDELMLSEEQVEEILDGCTVPDDEGEAYFYLIGDVIL